MKNPYLLVCAIGVLACRHAALGAESEVPGHVDFLCAAVAYADCMLEYGRDRYGDVHSPLFAVLLTREKEPRIGPQPRFADPERVSKHNPVFNRFDFKKVLNYPKLGSEGPHKVTLTGADLYEDAALYELLIDLSRITGNPVYRREAEQAIRWWFVHTQSPQTGLYPWGEHLGWDFEHECPTYFAGPSKHLYAACYHEIKDRVPFLVYLAKLPAQEGQSRTPLERYALGVWNAHYWDPENAIYCRHGDYTGQDDRRGSPEGYPAHQGAHLRLWVNTLLTTRDIEVKGRMRDILKRVLDVQIARARKHGFIPATFKHELQGKKPANGPQDERLARHSLEMSLVLAEADPALAAKLRRLATCVLGEGQVPVPLEKGPAGHAFDPGKKPVASLVDLSKARTPDRHAKAILQRVDWFREYGDAAYARMAEKQARMAYVQFCDDVCPLPKAVAGSGRIRTADGNVFPDFYFRGAALMHAFARVGEVRRELGE